MFIRCRKLNISLVFITQSYFSVPKDARLNTTFIENVYRTCTKERYNFLTIDTKLPASDPLRFGKKLFDSYKNDNN